MLCFVLKIFLLGTKISITNSNFRVSLKTQIKCQTDPDNYRDEVDLDYALR